MTFQNRTLVIMAIVAAASLRLSNSFVPHAFQSSSRHVAAAAAAAAAQTTPSRLFLLDKLFGTSVQNSKYPIYCDESVMSEKKHGTSEKPVQSSLRWNCDFKTADRICNFVRPLCQESPILVSYNGFLKIEFFFLCFYRTVIMPNMQAIGKQLIFYSTSRKTTRKEKVNPSSFTTV
jgi:hypothetical protein